MIEQNMIEQNMIEESMIQENMIVESMIVESMIVESMIEESMIEESMIEERASWKQLFVSLHSSLSEMDQLNTNWELLHTRVSGGAKSRRCHWQDGREPPSCFNLFEYFTSDYFCHIPSSDGGCLGIAESISVSESGSFVSFISTPNG
jgi:hypothetical protein